MLFNSVQFLFFFIAVTSLFFALPHRFRWALLLGASCLFYMAFVPQYILILAATIIVDYFAALYIDKSEGPRRKLYFIVSIWATIAILFVFKYFNFFNENVEALAKLLGWNYGVGALKLILPIGLSFHTFQSLSYVIEVYRGHQKPERHFGIYSLYVMFYPQLVAGPIERPQNVLHQFHEKHSFSWEQFQAGLLRMLWGLLKKVVIADRLAEYVGMVYNDPGNYSGLSVVLATIFFAIQIYCDFSGYSDIALGAAQTMGFRLMENFDNPYFSKNLSDFWKRWHVSLSTWFNDYLFNPLVVAKRDWGRRAVALGLITTFAVSGLWHGAAWTYVVWGLIHGLGLVALFYTAKTRKKINKALPSWFYEPLSVILTFAFVCFGYVFFAAPSLESAFTILGQMFHGWKLAMPFNSAIETVMDLLVAAGLVPLMFLVETRLGSNPLYAWAQQRHFAWKWAIAWVGIFILFNFGVFTSAQSFIYFQF